MLKCKQCGNTLKGKQKMFCSKKCKYDFYNHKELTEEQIKERKEKSKEWRDANKDRVSENKKRYYQKNRKKLLKKRKEYSRLHPEIDKRYKKSIKGRYMIYKRGAEKRNLVFEFTLEDFKKMWNSNCHYCGEKINGIGIDRIDNKIGYTNKNTVTCCSMCNRMKHVYTKEEFIKKCKQIADYA